MGRPIDRRGIAPLFQRHHLCPIDPMDWRGIRLSNAATVASFDIVDSLKQ